MMLKKPLLSLLIFLAGLSFICAQGRSTSQEDLVKTGISFYSEGKFTEAIGILQLVPDSPEALYWLSLAELSSGNFDRSLLHLEALEKTGANGNWSAEVPYHRARCYYYLGRHEEALVSLNTFTGSLPDADPRKASAYYWQGESLLALGRLDEAAGAFSTVIEKYPNSSKYEASYYRLNIINQKRIEAELLAILKWSHEESLKSMEEYQEREKNYELAITAYQKRINELLAASGGTAITHSVSEEAADYYQQRIVSADQRIAELEESLAEANAALLILRGEDSTDPNPLDDMERTTKMEELRALALELSNILTERLNEVEQ